MRDGQERRGSWRLRIPAPVEYPVQSGEGTGMVSDISMSGVQIVGASKRPEDGDTVRLRCSFSAGSFGVELAGRVVRQTDTGFVLQFQELGADQLAVIDRVIRSLREDQLALLDEAVRSLRK